MWLLSLPSWLQTIGASAICLALGFGGGFLKGYSVADARAQVEALKKSNSDLVKASEQKDVILADHAHRVEQDADADDRLAAELKGYLDASPDPAKPAACRLDAGELRFLQQLADRGGENLAQMPGGRRRSGH